MTPPALSIGRANLRARLILMLATMVAVSVLALGYAAVAAFDRAVEPELANRTRLIGTIVRTEVQRALELGIPIDAVAGLDRYLAATLEQFGEVRRIAITTAAGQPVAEVQRPATPSLLGRMGLDEVVAVSRTAFDLPILDGNRLVGGITVEINPQFVQTRLRDVFLDTMVLALIAILVAVELALAVAITTVGKPLDRVLRLLGEQRNGNFLHRIREGGLSGLGRTAARLNDHAEDLAARAAAIPEALRSSISGAIAAGRPSRLRLSDFSDIRLALFLFAVGTEIAASFMPLYARAADRPGWLGAEFAAAAPLVLYLAAIAAVSPFGSLLTGRFGPRPLFLIAAPGAAIALAGLGFSSGIASITVWQGLMAAFYAVAAIAGQEYAIRAADERDRAKAVGGFVAVAYGGLFAGSALGGLLAGRFGFDIAFFVGATLTALSIPLGAASMRGGAGDRAETKSAAVPVAPKPWLSMRYLALLLGIAVPMNATMVIFIWYLTPMMLSDLGSGPAEIARVLLLYSLALLLLGPAIARLADGRPGPVVLVLAGSLCLSGALLSLSFGAGFWSIVLAVTGVGVGQILIKTPLFALALRITGGSGPGIDALRVLERFGAIIGLAGSAVLLGQIGAEASIRLLGFAVLSGGAIYAIVEFIGKSKQG